MTARVCGCTPGACVTCAPRGGCPCHDLVTALGREPLAREIADATPAPPYRRALPPLTVTFSSVVAAAPKRTRRRKVAA